MLTPDESRTLAVLALLVAGGAALGLLEARRPDMLALTLGDSLALGFTAAATGSSASVRDSATAAARDSTPQTPASGDTASRHAYGPDGRLDLNRATAADLEALPGIGPKTAERIVADRARRGRFRSVPDLRRVKGIGPKTLARIAPHVTVRPVRGD